jgi:hypothetical protein
LQQLKEFASEVVEIKKCLSSKLHRSLKIPEEDRLLDVIGQAETWIKKARRASVVSSAVGGRTAGGPQGRVLALAKLEELLEDCRGIPVNLSLYTNPLRACVATSRGWVRQASDFLFRAGRSATVTDAVRTAQGLLKVSEAYLSLMIVLCCVVLCVSRSRHACFV